MAVSSATKELIELLNQEFLFVARKQFGMLGQIQFHVQAITKQQISVTISTRHPLEGAQLAENIRNAILNLAQDMLPCPRFQATYSNPTLGVKNEQHVLAFFTGNQEGSRPSSQILIEEHAEPFREKYRSRIEALFAQLGTSARPPAQTIRES